MLTVTDAAARAGCSAETMRRWIRAGRISARRDGTRLVVSADAVAAMLQPRSLPLPAVWRETPLGAQPDWAAMLRRSRRGPH